MHTVAHLLLFVNGQVRDGGDGAVEPVLDIVHAVQEVQGNEGLVTAKGPVGLFRPSHDTSPTQPLPTDTIQWDSKARSNF